jgi:hypothetical protein
MAQRRPDRPKLLKTHVIKLVDGKREVKVRDYDNGALRILVDNAPYVMTECWLPGGATDQSIIRLLPVPRAEAPDEDE